MYKWTIDDFELGKPLGCGKFGQVWMARDKRRNFIVALKITRLRDISKDALAVRQIRREIETQQNINSPFVLKFYGYFYDIHNIYYILEYASGGELFKQLELKRRFTEKESAQYLYQICMGIKELHRHNIIHRDLKPENILIGSDNRLKICDLGWAVCNIDNRRQTFCGTKEYLAPEVITYKKYSIRVDMWCLGILLYEFLTGETPFKPTYKYNQSELIRRAYFTMPDHLSSGAKDLISKLIVADPLKRLSVEEVIEHKWIKEYIQGSWLEYKDAL